jgi:hypothetical protein
MTRQVRKPRNIDEVLSGQLQSRVITADMPVPPGVTIYVTDSNNGRYRRNIKTVTVPVWAYNHTASKTNDDPAYAMYYVAHELAHAWVHADGGGDDSVHGARFYEWFKKLCPPQLWHYETEYKPRDAKRAGISTDPKTNEANAHGFEDVRTYDYPKAAGPTPYISDIRRDAIAADPRLKDKLANVRDSEVKSYVRGWFQL